ncbi:MAG: FAD-dependent oxidoreductase, partial [Chloroflexota bacterium]
ATGAVPARPPVPGIDLPHVVQAVDLLGNPALADKAERVVVIGGGTVGCEVAYMLAYERGKTVTVVEMLPYFVKGVCTANRGYLIHYLEKAGVNLLNCTRLKSVMADGVNLVRNVSPTVPDPYDTWSPVLPENVVNPLAKKIKVVEEETFLAADLVVLATGMKPDDQLFEACLKAHVAPEIRNIGDSFGVGRIFEATKAGYAVGLAI